MTLDISIHKTVLFQILKDIYGDSSMAPFLGFKGGTATLMFYGLDRFSVDVDLDLLDESKEDEVFERVKEIVKKYGSLKEAYKKRFNLFFLVSYETGQHTSNVAQQKVKVEINRRQFGSKYELKNYLGVSMLVMVKEDLFAHKLMAMYERMGKTSRDIYDVWFFLTRRLPINKKIVEERSGMKFDQLLKKCVKQLEDFDNKDILKGLGELLTPSRKDWVKEKLKEETVGLLKLRISKISKVLD